MHVRLQQREVDGIFARTHRTAMQDSIGGCCVKQDLRIETLETPRLVLRPYRLDDAERLTELLQDSEIHRWTNSIPYPYTLEHAHEFLQMRAKDDASGDSYVWAITNGVTGELMGAIGLHDVKPDRGRAELGYWLGEEFRGAGYTTEAARRVVSWSFETGQFNRIQATFVPGNEPSRGVMQKIGMQEEGRLRGYGFKNGEHQDLILYAVLRSDPTWTSTADQSS